MLCYSPVTTIANPVQELSLYRLILIHLRVGNLTFGGGDPSLAALHAEIVATKRWVSPEKFAVAYALARVTPGTNLLAFCAGICWELMGWRAASAALLAMTVPSAVLVVILTESYSATTSNRVAMAAMGGILAAAVAMMPAAAWQLVRPYLSGARWIHAVVIVSAAATLSLKFSVSPIQILGLAAVCGLIWRVPE
jgi:chromate transporter